MQSRTLYSVAIFAVILIVFAYSFYINAAH